MTYSMPRIDVVIPAYNEEASIGRCLDATLGQSYPPERVRVLLVDAGCSDRTFEIARGRDDPRLVIVANGGRRLTTPEALNAGIERSDAELVARVDAHGWPEPDFLERAEATLTDGGADVACVGGRPLPSDVHARARLALRRGRERLRRARQARGDRHGALGHVQAQRPAGRRRVRPAHAAWRGRGAELAHPPRRRAHPPQPADSLPLRAALLVRRRLLAAAAPFSRAARAGLAGALGAYASAATVCALDAARRDDITLAPLVAVCFPALHAGYGVGTLSGIVHTVRAGASDRSRSLSSPSHV